MSLFLRIDINIIAMVLLGIIFCLAYKSLDKKDKINEIFLYMSLIIILEILFETLTCVINTYPNQSLIPVSIFLHMCLFITAPILTYFWYKFVRYWMKGDSKISLKKNILLLTPSAINLIITLLSPFYDFVFYIDSLNQYKRGSLFLISAFITYFYIFLSFFLILKERKKFLKEDYLPLLIFGILPIAGAIVQTLFYGTLLMWSCCSFSLIIVYNFLQQRMVHLDKLSGAWTRSSFDYYIARRIKIKNNETFGIIFADIDNLKDINDKYGHLEGDLAIKNTVSLFRSVLRKTDIIARFGGDEFIIVLECDSRDLLDKTIERIKCCFNNYNYVSSKDYKIECSYGADIFDVNNNNIEQFIFNVDSMMYCSKKEKKLNLEYNN